MLYQHPVIRSMRDDWQMRLVCQIAHCLPEPPKHHPDTHNARLSPTPFFDTLPARYRNDSHLTAQYPIMLIDPDTRRRIYRRTFPRWQNESRRQVQRLLTGSAHASPQRAENRRRHSETDAHTISPTA